MKNIWLLATITFREGVRNRALHGIFFFAVALCGINFIVTNSFTRDLGKVAVDVGLSTISVCGLAIIFFMGMSLLAKDLDKLTVYMVLSRPIPRWHYILGKYTGLCLLIIISVVILGAMTAGFVKVIMVNNPGYIPPLFSWTTFVFAILFSLLSLLVVTALAILFTCLTSSSFMALVLTGGSYLIGQNVELVRHLLSQSNPEGGGMAVLIKIVSWIFPNLAAFDFKTTAAYGLPVEYAEILFTGVYGITYAMLVLLIATLVFNRRELT